MRDFLRFLRRASSHQPVEKFTSKAILTKVRKENWSGTFSSLLFFGNFCFENHFFRKSSENKRFQIAKVGSGHSRLRLKQNLSVVLLRASYYKRATSLQFSYCQLPLTIQQPTLQLFVLAQVFLQYDRTSTAFSITTSGPGLPGQTGFKPKPATPRRSPNTIFNQFDSILLNKFSNNQYWEAGRVPPTWVLIQLGLGAMDHWW